jgi:multidrug resistance efflux pump
MLKKISKIVIPVLIIVLTLLLARYLYQTKAQKPTAEITERVWRVETIEAKSGHYPASIILYGKVEAPDLYNASAPAFGRVEKINIKEGQSVSKGQLLAIMDKADFMPGLKMAQAKVASFDAQIKNEELRYRLDQQALKHQKSLLVLGKESLKRTEKVHKQNLASQAEIDESKKRVLQQQLTINTLKLSLEGFDSRLKSLNANKEQAQAEEVKAQLSLQRSDFYAPFDGIIASVDVAVGDQLSTGKNLFSIYPLNALEIRAKIPSHLRQRIEDDLQQGDSLSAYVDGLEQHSLDQHEFKLSRLSGQASASGVDAFFSSSNKLESLRHISLRPGNIKQLRLLLPSKQVLFSAPYIALYGKNKLYKLVKDDSGAMRMKSIKIKPLGEFRQEGENTKSLLLFSSDQIQSGDKIIITHLPNALNGLKVEAL